MFIAFGAAFEVPIAVVVLARLGVVSIEKLKAFRAYFIVLAFIIAAVLTPPDVVSQLALAIPMVLLYEVGIWAAQIFIKPHAGAGRRDDADEPRRREAPARCAGLERSRRRRPRSGGRCADRHRRCRAPCRRAAPLIVARLACGLSAATALSSCGVLATGAPAIFDDDVARAHAALAGRAVLHARR